jgi:hypothetical protein
VSLPDESNAMSCGWEGIASRHWGDALLSEHAYVLPGGMEAAKAEVRRVLAAGAYARGLAAIDDPDLADQASRTR